ncbi:Protein Fam47C-Like [Manis pentadactyla]|nr:Protein Fam47C-Like [Manis pentadactyla]
MKQAPASSRTRLTGRQAHKGLRHFIPRPKSASAGPEEKQWRTASFEPTVPETQRSASYTGPELSRPWVLSITDKGRSFVCELRYGSRASKTHVGKLCPKPVKLVAHLLQVLSFRILRGSAPMQVPPGPLGREGQHEIPAAGGPSGSYRTVSSLRMALVRIDLGFSLGSTADCPSGRLPGYVLQRT